jgi:hypothetical protein
MMKTSIQELFIALVWLALPALVQAQFTTFTTNNGAITITGYNAAAGLNVVIPAMTNGYPVTSIGDYAFNGSPITNVTIPNSVTSIGYAAFHDCTGLTSITVDASNSAYSSMNGVLFDKPQATLLQFPGGLGGSYTIPNGVTSLGDSAFDSCTSLTSVIIPNSVTSIGYAAFRDCIRLKNVSIPDGVTNIGTYAFTYCTSLTSVTIPNSVTSLGDFMFESSGITNVTIPNSVTNIGSGTFKDCTRLKNVSIPDGVTSIGYDAFANCTSLTSVTIPKSVTSIGMGFYNCTSLTSINVDAANPVYSSMNGVLFGNAQATLLEFPGGLGGSYTIPNSVTSIGSWAFYNCTNLTSVTIPNSVTYILDYAFYNCTRLTSVTIPNSVTYIEGGAFGACFSLTSAYFQGNAPPNENAFFDSSAIVYYLTGATGWGSTFSGRPAVLWNPQASAPAFTGGQFGFNLIGPANAVIVVETCTNLSDPVWRPVSTNTLSSLGASAFSDPQSGGYPMRYYRFRSP